MSNRPVARPVSTAFANLKPTIIRQPARSSVSAESEARLLESPATSTIQAVAEEGTALPGHSAGLLQPRRRPVLIPVTFRTPQALKDRLEKVARTYGLNQTDLINEAIELNLKRYLVDEGVSI